MAHQEPRKPFVFTGNYSKEFLEKMGYKKFVPPVIHNVGDGPLMPAAGAATYKKIIKYGVTLL